MNKIVKISIVIVTLLASSTLPGIDEEAFALSCSNTMQPLNLKSYAVFNGTVISKKIESSSVGGIKVLFQVDQSYNGKMYGLLNLTTGYYPWFGGNVLEDPFQVGENYMVYAERKNGTLYVGGGFCETFALPDYSLQHLKDNNVPLPEPEILPPKYQIFNKVSAREIICNAGLELIFKSSDDSPVCVKPTTKQKLIQRGWAIDDNIGGTSSQSCNLIPDPGLCKAAFTKYYFDPDTKTCKAFTWGGCEGTVPFDTLELCQSLCS